MATNKLLNKPKTTQGHVPKPGTGKVAKDKVSRTPILGNEILSEPEVAELNRLAVEINQRLEHIHEDMQDIIRDMRAMRGGEA